MEYRTSSFESFLESKLNAAGSTLSAPRTVLDEGFPPNFDRPIVSRTISGSMTGAYQRYVMSDVLIPLTTVDDIAALRVEPEMVEEEFTLQTEPGVYMTATYRVPAVSDITEFEIHGLERRAAVQVLVEACRSFPPGGDLKLLTEVYPLELLEALIRALPNAYNTKS